MVESIKELRKICQTKRQPLYMEFVAMKISIYITKLFLYSKISADYVTMFMMILLIVGSIFMASGGLWMILVGILIIHSTIILDNVNGEVARYRKEDGIIGTFLEQVYHNLAVPLIFFGLAYGVFLRTNLTLILVFGFLAAIFGKPLILKSIKDAVVEERLSEIRTGKKAKISLIRNANIRGGSTKTGKGLYSAYDIVREFWVFPANIVHITILSVIEVINIQQGFMPPYFLLSLYLIIYGSASTLIQLAAFIVNYRGRTADHYYKELFHRK